MWFLLLAITWIGVGTVYGFLSGWYGLMSRYPDRNEPALLRLKFRSGALGLVPFCYALHLSVCPSGLRVGILILVGPFSRDFLVPWSFLSVSHQDNNPRKHITILDFGSNRLRLSAQVADQLARAAGSRWPAPEPLLEDARAVGAGEWLKRMGWLKWWVLPAGMGAAAWIVLPLLSGPPGYLYPVFVLGLFLPAAVVGLAFLVERLRER